MQEKNEMMSNNAKRWGWSFRHDKYYNSDPLNAKFTFTIINKIRQVFIRCARKEEGRTFKAKSTLVVNANGAFVFHVVEEI